MIGLLFWYALFFVGTYLLVYLVIRNKHLVPLQRRVAYLEERAGYLENYLFPPVTEEIPVKKKRLPKVRTRYIPVDQQ